MMAHPLEVLPEGAVLAPARRWSGHWREAGEDALAEEVPVALVFNGISHAVMMATPTDLEDFALGFALTEGLIETAAELYGVEAVRVPAGMEVRLDVAAACAWRLKERRRTLAGRTGCGLCGIDSLAQVRRALPAVPAVSVPAAAVARAEQSLREWQHLQHFTGSTHAAAWADLGGNILLAREDVGRHNALDKLVGALTKARIDTRGGFVLVTSRASFEMVQKTVALGAGLLAAVSAPTAWAVACAQEANLCVAGFVREGGLTAYTFAERLMCSAGRD
ncbi:MAG: hypothetical protein RJA36_3751 [Pseudomonadota bacterium]|jgi:FdhD protein